MDCSLSIYISRATDTYEYLRHISAIYITSTSHYEMVDYNGHMEIAKAFTEGCQPISFEIFPPKGDLTHEVAHKVAEDLAELHPDFISVTYSAGGSGNSNATMDIVHLIQSDFDVPSLSHLTCINLSKDGLRKAVTELKEQGINNVLALRGDKVQDSNPTDFFYAHELISRLVQEGFCVGAAAYPEGHIECHSMHLSIEHLKQKQDVGASFLVSQLFFDNNYFYSFLEQARSAHIDIPIAAGVMPFLSKDQIQRMVFMCGASLPSPIIKILARYEGDPVSLRQAGIEYAANQLLDLQSQGVDGLHIYTMNQPDIARQIMANLQPRRKPSKQSIPDNR